MASIEKYKTASGAVRYQVRFDVYTNGQREQKKKSFKTSKDASAFRSKVEHAINTGMYADARGLTVGEYLDLWVNTYTANIRPNSEKSYRAIVNHVKQYIGNVHLENLSTLAIQKMYGDILKEEYNPARYEEREGLRVLVRPAKTYSPKTIKNIHAVLHLALDQARKEGLIARNPAEDVKLPSIKKHERIIPTPEQMKHLLDALVNAESFPAILTCAVLGCRRGEALGLYWSDINFSASTVEIKRALVVNSLTNAVEVGELKTETSRRILPMPDVLRDLLLRMKQEKEQAASGAGAYVIQSPFVFTTIQGKPFRPESISQAFKRAAAKVGIPQMRLHDLRHTAITYMLEAGANPRTVSEFAGHSTPGFTMSQYAHVLDQSKKNASDALMKTLFSN